MNNLCPPAATKPTLVKMAFAVLTAAAPQQYRAIWPDLIVPVKSSTPLQLEFTPEAEEADRGLWLAFMVDASRCSGPVCAQIVETAVGICGGAREDAWEQLLEHGMPIRADFVAAAYDVDLVMIPKKGGEL